MMRVLSLVLGVLCLAGTTSGQSTSPEGHLILNGGGSKPQAVMEKFVELAGGKNELIVVFPTASSDNSTGRYYRKLFAKEYGCTNVRVAAVKDRRDAQRREFVELVEKAGGIFFSGGDQRRITAAMKDTPLEQAVLRAWERGAVVGGTSAGTACMSPQMITGDGDFTVITAKNVEIWPGLGLLTGAIVDQHFVARSRQNRLIAVVLENPELIGVGIDEATAIWVKPDGSFQVIGEGWVMVFDASRATVRRLTTENVGEALGVVDLVTHVLVDGDSFDMIARTVKQDITQ
jgi:cyanophycinase